MLALLDYRTMLKFMTLRLADSAASQARGGRFKFKIRGTNCGIPYWRFGRRLGLFILSLQHLTSEHWVVSNGRLSLHKGSNVLQLRRPSALNNLIVFVLPFDDQVIRKTANDTLEVCCDVCFTFNVALKNFCSCVQLLRKVHESNIIPIGQPWPSYKIFYACLSYPYCLAKAFLKGFHAVVK